MSGSTYFDIELSGTNTDFAISGWGQPFSVINYGTIEGTQFGISISGGAGTVENAGTIIAASGTAVALDSTYGGVVVVDPGAVFQGTVSGGNAALSVLELAPAESTGTMTGFGSQFIDFKTVAVDPGASWSFSGDNTIASGVTLANAGTVSFTGSLHVAGVLSGADGTAISFANDSSLLVIEQGATVDGAIAGFRPGDRIELPGVAVTGATLGSGNVLNLQQSDGGTLTLNLAPDQNYSGYVFTVDTSGAGSSGIGATLNTGPTAGNGATTLGHNQQVDLTSLINGLVTPGHAGDTETVTAASVLFGSASLINGVVAYTSPANGADTLSYTVTDQFGDTASGTVNVTVDPGPTAATGAVTLGHNKAANLTSLVNGLVTPGLAGDSETLTAVNAAHGSASLINGVVTYTAPTSGVDTLSYTVTDQFGDTASGTVNVTIDPGPTAATGAVTLGHDKAANLTSLVNGLVTPGLTGDTETVTAVSAAHGSASLINGVVTYTAPTSGVDTLGYTVTDQFGDTASGTVNVTIDPGPTAATGAVTLGHNKTVNLTSLVAGLVTPGFAGDTETVTAVSAAHGSASVSGGVLSYTTPTAGPDSLTYTVTDQFGNTASGTINVTVDPGPRAGAATIILAAGQSIDLTSYLLGMDTPGIVGDILTLTGANTAGTRGSVTLSNGNLGYVARATAGTDSFGYTVSDPYGDNASAIVSVTAVSSFKDIGRASGTILLGNYSGPVHFGDGTVTVIAGDGKDRIRGGNGNDTVIAGDGNDKVRLGNGNDTVRLGNGSNRVRLGNGNDTLQLGDGNNTLEVGNGNDTVHAGDGNNRLQLGNGKDTVQLGDGSNTLQIGNGSSAVTLGNGNNTLDVGNGNDTIQLGNGNNTLRLGNGNDTVHAGDGNNRLQLGNDEDTEQLGNGSNTLQTGNGSGAVTLGNGNNTLRLGNGSNIVTLGTGSNNVTVGNQNNTITITGSASSTETIHAGNGNNLLNLGAGTYNVAVGNGSDTIILGNGKYNVTNGNGSPDRFIYTVSSGLLTTSFNTTDQLVFRDSGFDLGVNEGHGTLMQQAIAATLFSPNTDGTFATPGNRFAYDRATGDLYYDATGSAAGSGRVLVADLTNRPHLSAANLFFTN